MTLVTQRDVRGLRAGIRRYANEAHCDEFESLVKHWERFGSVDLTRLQPHTAAWVTEAYVVLSHEIATLRRAYRAAHRAEHGAPALTQTVSGVTCGQLLNVLQTVDEQPERYELPRGGNWTAKVVRLQDAWLGSQHLERYQLDFWGPTPLVERVAAIVYRELFP